MTNEKSDASLTIDEFCRLERISLSSYHKLQHLGRGPKVLRIPGTNIVRIPAQARRNWHAEMATLAEQDAARLEQERRRELASRAGRAAVKSASHVCNRSRRDRNV